MTPTIEEYDSGNWLMFLCFDLSESDFVSLIISAYSEQMLMSAFHEDVFGGNNMTYTMVEK